MGVEMHTCLERLKPLGITSTMISDMCRRNAPDNKYKMKIVTEGEMIERFIQDIDKLTRTGRRFYYGMKYCDSVGLSEDECTAILLYTEEDHSLNFYTNLNKALREAKGGETPYDGFKTVLTRALSKLPHFEGSIHRGTRMSQELEAAKVGDVVQLWHYPSTSLDLYTAKGHIDDSLLTIHVPPSASQSAHDISKVSSHGVEAEILI